MTNQDRKEAITMHNSGKSQREIAEYFNVSRNTIKEIIRRYKQSKGY